MDYGLGEVCVCVCVCVCVVCMNALIFPLQITLDAALTVTLFSQNQSTFPYFCI